MSTPLTLEQLDDLPVGAAVKLTEPIGGRHELALKVGSKSAGYGQSIWRTTEGSTYPGSGVMRYKQAVLLTESP